MADKRMFTKKVTDSDAFIEMSSAAQALYFHLNQGADDDGFNNQVQMAMWKAHASIDDLKVLLAKNYIIRFESGVIVIKHWRMHNTLRRDRYTPTNFQEELNLLGIKDNGAYTIGCQVVDERLPSGCQVVDERLPSGCQVVDERLPQVSIGKGSIDKVSIVEGSVADGATTATEDEAYRDDKLKCIGGTLGKGVVYLTQRQFDSLIEKLGLDAFERYLPRLADFIIDKKAHVKSHYDTILKWYEDDTKVN